MLTGYSQNFCERTMPNIKTESSICSANTAARSTQSITPARGLMALISAMVSRTIWYSEFAYCAANASAPMLLNEMDIMSVESTVRPSTMMHSSPPKPMPNVTAFSRPTLSFSIVLYTRKRAVSSRMPAERPPYTA